MAGTEDYRELNRRVWDDVAAAWERRRDWQEPIKRPVTERLLAQLDPRPGQTILELAGGYGEVGMRVAEAVGPAGRAVLTDLAPGMVAAAARRAAELELGNVDARVMDAEAMDLADDSVDGVVCRMGYMLMPDRDAALAETRRVLRPGGRLTFAVWGSPLENPFFLVPASVLIERGHFTPDPSGPGLFSLSTAEAIEAFVTAAGFDAPTVERVELLYRYADADELWSFASEFAGPVASAIQALEPDERERVREAILLRAEPFRDGEGYGLPAVSLVAATR